MSVVKEPGAGRRRRPSSVRAVFRQAAFEALYSRFAWAYDWVSRTFFLGQWRVWQRAALHYIEGSGAGSRVLEIGMGTGDLQLDIQRRGIEAWGIDYSPQMLGRAISKAERLGAPQLRVCRARAQALPFPDNCFDAVISTFPSDYIADPETLREAARVLRPRGRLVIVPGGWLKTDNSKSKALEGLARLVYGDKSPRSSRNTNPESHAALHSPLERLPASAGWVRALRESMTEAGFKVEAHVASNERGAAIIVVATLG